MTIELHEAQFRAELPGMAPSNPGEVIAPNNGVGCQSAAVDIRHQRE
jgi:hypothetical protein